MEFESSVDTREIERAFERHPFIFANLFSITGPPFGYFLASFLHDKAVLGFHLLFGYFGVALLYATLMSPLVCLITTSSWLKRGVAAALSAIIPLTFLVLLHRNILGPRSWPIVFSDSTFEIRGTISNSINASFLITVIEPITSNAGIVNIEYNIPASGKTYQFESATPDAWEEIRKFREGQAKVRQTGEGLGSKSSHLVRILMPEEAKHDPRINLRIDTIMGPRIPVYLVALPKGEIFLESEAKVIGAPYEPGQEFDQLWSLAERTSIVDLFTSDGNLKKDALYISSNCFNREDLEVAREAEPVICQIKL